MKSLKVTGQSGNVKLQEVKLEHVSEDILYNNTSDKPETKYTSVYGVNQTESKTTTFTKSLILPNSVNNVIVAADIAGIGKEFFDFDINTSESISKTKTKSITTSPQPYTVKPNQVLKVVTELYGLEYEGTVDFTAETDQKDINFSIQARGSVCRGVPDGVFRETYPNENFPIDSNLIRTSYSDILDKRDPFFSLPKGVEVPDCLQEWLADNEEVIEDNPLFDQFIYTVL